MVSTRGEEAAAPLSAPAPMREIVREPRAWAVMVFMGLQSGIYYTMVTWMPTQLQSVGMSVAAASIGLTVFSTIGMVGSFWAPRLVGTARGPGVWLAVAVANTVGLALILTGGVGSWVGVSLVGIGQGASFAIALTFIAHSVDPHRVGAMSAFAQGAGYLLAAPWPSGFGALYASSGSWLGVQIGIMALVMGVGLLGVRLMRA